MSAISTVVSMFESGSRRHSGTQCPQWFSASQPGPAGSSPLIKQVLQPLGEDFSGIHDGTSEVDYLPIL